MDTLQEEKSFWGYPRHQEDCADKECKGCHPEYMRNFRDYFYNMEMWHTPQCKQNFINSDLDTIECTGCSEMYTEQLEYWKARTLAIESGKVKEVEKKVYVEVEKGKCAGAALPKHKLLFAPNKEQIIGPEYDYVFDVPHAQFRDTEVDGWFERGQVHLVAGSSGAGKTRWLIPAMDAMAKGQEYFGHPSKPLPYLILGFDRNKRSATRTFKKMGLGHCIEHFIEMEYAADEGAVFAIRDAIEKQPTVPAVVVIEGLDITISKPNEAPAVSRVLSLLNQLAFYYHIAIIGTVGSPKQNNKQFYELDRDSIYGSAIWGRMTDTVIIMKYVRPKKGQNIDADNFRNIRACTRDGKPETFPCVWVGGRLLLAEGNEPPEAEDPTVSWIKGQTSYWTIPAMAAALNMSESACRRVVKKLNGKVQEKPGPKGSKGLKEYRWVGSGCQIGGV